MKQNTKEMKKMSKLIIAEKPSVGMSIAYAVGAKSSHDGYIEGGIT